MIKDLESIQHHELREDIWGALVSHERFPDCCRYTWAEMERYADHLRELSWKTNRSPDFMARFNRAETNIINFLAGSTTRESRVDAWKQRHKTAVQLCQRLVGDITKFVEETERLRTEYQRTMSKRLTAGLDVDESMKKRFDQKTNLA